MVALGGVLWAAAVSGGHEPPLAEWRVKREAVFEFARRPRVARRGDRFIIEFEAKGLCDATVAVEDAKGGIVRHLASGVLGPSAPPPLRAGSRKQTLVWDGKDDRGRYVDDPSRLAVRVSLGLRPQYEQSLNEAPMKLPAYRSGPGKVSATKRGVYYFTFGAGVSFLRLLDHDGDYVRTIYPFPAGKLPEVRGLIHRRFPQTGEPVPVKWGLNQNTFLTGSHLESGRGWPESQADDPATTLAVRGDGAIALVHQRICRLASDGSTGGLDLIGPQVSFDLPMSRVHSFPGGTYRAHPRSGAFSPDGKTLYLAGYFYRNPWRLDVLHGVAKVAFEGGREARAEVFAGHMDKRKYGSGPGEFNFPAAVATDAEGRVYVADYLNDRVQVFSPGAKLLKSIAIEKPVDLAIHHRTGEIYVFRWYFRNDNLSRLQGELEKKRQRLEIRPRMVRLGPLADPKVRSVVDLPLPCAHWGGFGHQGEFFDAALDSWTDPPRIWLTSRDNWRGWDPTATLPKAYVERGGKLVAVRSFVKQVRARVGRVVSPRHGRCRVYVNPADGRLYVGESHSLNAKSFDDLVQIDPQTRRHRFVQLPFHSEDLAFDVTGQAYLRTENMVVRYRMGDRGLREAPFDYGVEAGRVGYSPHSSGRFAKVIAGVDLPSRKPGYWIMGGLAVSPSGRVAVACYNPGTDPSRREDKPLGGGKAYKPKIYPGRPVGWEVHVLDNHGRMLHADAVPGSRQMFGIGIDREGELYCMTPARRMLPDGTPYPNDVSCTVFRAAPGKARFVTAGKAPVPIGALRPDEPPHIQRGLYEGQAWILGARWLYGGVGNAAKYIGRAGGGCWCQYAQMTLDLFARTFVPEPDIYSVAVLDKCGNLIARIGRYGNPDDGLPLRKDTARPAGRRLGGDEVALFNPQHVAAHTDRRLFISDIANGRIVSVKLNYHATETVALKDVPDTGP